MGKSKTRQINQNHTQYKYIRTSIIMKTQTISINEGGLSVQDAQTMITKIIDCQINNLKSKFFADWERDHNTDQAAKDQKIADLVNQKKELISAFNQEGGSEATIELNLYISASVEQPESAGTVSQFA